MANIDNPAYESLKLYIKEHPSNIYVNGLYAFEVKVNKDRIRFYRGKINRPVESYRYTEGNVCRWEVYPACGVVILRLWLARNNKPILSSGPQEGEEHQITHEYLVFEDTNNE